MVYESAIGGRNVVGSVSGVTARWGVEPHFPRHGIRGISSYAIVGTVATVVFSVTYASSPILSPVGFPGLLT